MVKFLLHFVRCGLLQKVCVPKPCPTLEELECDPFCEKLDITVDKCECASTKCVKKGDEKPECDECHQLQKVKHDKCEAWECVPKRVGY